MASLFILPNEKLASYLGKEKEHIVRKAMQLRKKPNIDRKGILIFCNEAEEYLDYLEKRAKLWKAQIRA